MTAAKTKRPATLAGVGGAGNSVKRLHGNDTTSTPITPTNIDFLCHAFRHCIKDESPIVCGFPGDVAEAPPYVWAGGSAFPLPAFIRRENNNYVCISTFLRSADAKFRRRLDSWSGLHLLLLDDIGTKISATNVLLPPSLVVETSPKNFQYWYLLAQPERNKDRAEALINGLIDAGASDPGAGNLSRLGRLPQGINGKAKYMKRGKPFVQRVHTWEPSRRYTADDIAAAYGIDLHATRPNHHAQGNPADAAKHDGFLRLLELAGLYIEPIRSTSGAHRIICPWHMQHTGQDKTGSAYFEPSEANGFRAGFVCHHAACRGRTIADLDLFASALLRGDAA